MLSHFFRYGIIGVITNVIGYLVYLALTQLWGMPKVMMTISYVLCAFFGFQANRLFTFNYKGDVGRAGVRFIISHVMGYLLNFLILLSFVDHFGYPHEWVQAAAILIVAMFLFLLSKFFVFSGNY
jgi:putative flippase GtrA